MSHINWHQVEDASLGTLWVEVTSSQPHKEPVAFIALVNRHLKGGKPTAEALEAYLREVEKVTNEHFG